MNEPATPALIVDLPTVERNLRSMAEYAAAHRLALRPHSKTHKSLRLARLQMACGAVGLTVAKVGEADVMARAADDVLVAYPAVDVARCRALARLAAEHAISVALDSAQAIEAIGAAVSRAGSTVGILIELDAGFHRTGVQSPEASLALARRAAAAKGVRLDGLMIFPGHLSGIEGQAEELARIGELLDRTIELWRRAGLEARIVSGGSTPTARRSHLLPSLTEIRPGTYIFNDMKTVAGGHVTVDDCAARVCCTVVSDAVPGAVVLDAGSKALSSELLHQSPDDAYGFVVEHPEGRVVRLSEEHGVVDVSRCGRRPKVGERVHVIPNHICTCVNLFDSMWLRHADGDLEETPVDARGRLS
jgi:D-serine deaminase-like pyridoxal phosphate-dependent protein